MSAEIARLNAECEHLRMQIGYLAAELSSQGDKRSIPEIVENAAQRTEHLKPRIEP